MTVLPATVEYGTHLVEDGRVFTSAGISAAIDLSLEAVEHVTKAQGRTHAGSSNAAPEDTGPQKVEQ